MPFQACWRTCCNIVLPCQLQSVDQMEARALSLARTLTDKDCADSSTDHLLPVGAGQPRVQYSDHTAAVVVSAKGKRICMNFDSASNILQSKNARRALSVYVAQGQQFEASCNQQNHHIYHQLCTVSPFLSTLFPFLLGDNNCLLDMAALLELLVLAGADVVLNF